MKKFGMIFSILAVLAFIAVPAFSCDGAGCYGSGNFDGHVAAGSAALDYGMTGIPNGAAGGIAGAAGGTIGGIHGRVNDGESTANIEVVGGGLAGHTDYRFGVPADLSIGVGSQSHAEAVTKGSVYLTSNADRPGWWDHNYGVARGGFIGGAAQGTLDGSYVGSSPLPMWDSEGHSGGIAGQGSAGFIVGGAEARTSRPSCWSSYPDKAYARARISMEGNSGSESYRYINFQAPGVKTEGMGTNVFANTVVTTNGESSRDGFTHGGFIAGGVVCAKTVQRAPGLGGAVATGHGSYGAIGGLNCNYSGSVTGSTYTSVTTVEGLNGSINSAGSSMSVSSHVTGNTPD